MKTHGLSLAAFAAIGLAVPALAKPTGPLVQRNVVEKAFTTVVVSAPQITEHVKVVAYVDQNGNLIRKVTEIDLVPAAEATQPAEAVGIPEAHSQPSEAVGVLEAPSKPAEAVGVPEAHTTQPADAVGIPISANHDNTNITSEDCTVSCINSTVSDLPVVPSDGSRSLPGIAYAPYTASGDCKSQEMIENDFASFKNKYSLVRIYGTDCEQVSKVYPAAKKAGLRLFLGLFELVNVEGQVKHIVDSVKGDWGIVDTISVGNELINNGGTPMEQLLGAMAQAKTLLRSAGYQGPVVIVDTFVAVLTNPVLCDVSDYCAINLHPFFDGNVAAPDSGDFVVKMVSEVRSKLADKSKRVVVTETGWPWKGTNNKVAHPGRYQQKQAIKSISAAYASEPENLILFSAFNDPWKPSEARTFYAEQFWGIDARDSDY